MSKRTQSDLKTKSKSEFVISAGAQLTLFGQPAVTLKAKTPLPMTSFSPVTAALGLNFKWPPRQDLPLQRPLHRL